MNRNVLIFSVCTLLLVSCNAHKEADTKPKGIFLTDSLKHVVSLDTIQCLPLSDELTLNGKVDFNQEEVARVSPLLGGTVTSVRAELGDYVTKGSLLATIRSGEVAEYGKQKAEAQQQLLMARRNLSATKDLFDAGMASQKEMFSSQQDIANAQANLKRMKEIYSIYHVSANAVYQVKAPVSGFIVEKNVN